MSERVHDAGEVAPYFAGTPLAASLAQVRLGMTLRELHRVRPAVTNAPWRGAQEIVGQDTVEYRFPEGEAPDLVRSLILEWTPSDSAAALRAVQVRNTFPSFADAERAWRRWGRQLGSGASVECFRRDLSPGREAQVVLRTTGGVTAGAVLIPPTTLGQGEGSTTYPAALRVVATLDVSDIVPSTAVRQPLACP